MGMVVAMAAASPATRPEVAVAPVEAAVVRGCGEGVESTLRRALGRSKRVRVAADAGRAPLVLEVLECSRLDQTFRASDYGEKSGLEKGGIVASEFEFGVGRDSVRTVILRARLRGGSRFVEVASGPDDPDLGKAAESLRREVDKVVKERGAWLMMGPDSAEEVR
jgi:hypothetical protein